MIGRSSVIPGRIGPMYPVFLKVGMILLLSSAPARAQQTLSVTGVGLFGLSGAPEGLSGLTRADGNQYYAVEDSGARLHPMTIQIDPTSGAISSASFSTHITLSGSDLEGVAFNAANNSVYVSDESGATIKEYDLYGAYLSSVNVPAVYAGYRSNYSLESLSRQAGGVTLWTANEEALYNASTGVNDGPLSTTGNGSVVRLQRFDADLNPDGQWAYVTERITSYSPWTDSERSGVSDLCILPNGKVLLLERELNGEGFMGLPQFANRIYELDFTGATDVSGITALEGATYTPVTKHLLWSGSFGMDNFEGLTLGPRLDDGDYCLLMISDGDDEPNESLYSLRLVGDVSIPGDLDGDGFVGQGDLDIVLGEWGETVAPNSQPDPSGDGFVGQADLDIVLGDWGEGEYQKIPEPASASLLLLGAVAMLKRKRKSRA